MCATVCETVGGCENVAVFRCVFHACTFFFANNAIFTEITQK